MSNQVRDIHASGNAMIQVGNNTSDKTKQDIINECLANLRRPTDPRQDKSRIEKKKGGLLVDSYDWVLHSPEYQQWRDDNECRLLWVKGDPGKGKTMLLCGIIDNLRPFTQLQDPDSKVLMSYFFCEATNSSISNAAAVLRGLIYLLAVQQPPLTSYILDKQHGNSEQDTEHWNAFESMSDILSLMLGDPIMKDAYLIIDALDECKTDLNLLLDFITSSCSSQVKWIVSGRNHRNIEEHLSPASKKVPLSLELNEHSVSTAVNHFIRHRVEELRSVKVCNSEEWKFIQDYLGNHAGGTFLWVALVCSELEKSPAWNLVKHVQKFPEGLDPLYKLMMEQIKKSTTADLCEQVLKILTIAYQPLTAQELASLEGTISDVGDIPSIVSECGSFLTTKDDIIYFVHQSAKDYLVKEFRNMQELHYLMFRRSLKAMSILKQDIYSLVYPWSTVERAILQRPGPDPLAGARYSCLFWTEHLLDANTDTEDNHNPGSVRQVREDGEFKKFLDNKILFWVEALVLIQALSNGTSAMFRIWRLFKSQCKSDTNSDLVPLIWDTYSFMQYFQPSIEEYPLQVYAAGLVFSPTESLVRRRFQKYAPTWATKIEMESDLDTQAFQDDCLQVLDTGERLEHMSFSPEGQQLMALLTDGSPRMWGATDGARQPLKQKDRRRKCRKATMSPDWKWLATCCSNGEDREILEVWDYDANIVKWSKLSSRSISNLEFSPDNGWLAIIDADFQGSMTGLLQLWEMRTNTVHKCPLGAANPERAWTRFSSDSQLVAVNGGLEISVFGVRTGNTHNTLLHYITTCTFLPNSHKLLLSKWMSDEVKVLDVEMQILEDYLSLPILLEVSTDRDGIQELVISPDGQLLVVVTVGIAHIYDATSFTLRQSVLVEVQWNDYPFSSSDHRLAVISPNNKQLAVSSANGQIWLWDLPHLLARPLAPPKQGGDTFGGKISLLPNKNLLASVFGDSEVRVWNTATGHLLSTTNVAGGVRSLVWSSDGHILAIISDIKATLCDPTTGRHIHTFTTDEYSPVYISPGPPPGIAHRHKGLAERIWEQVKSQSDYKKIKRIVVSDELLSSPCRSNLPEPISYDEQPHRRWVATLENGILFLRDALEGELEKIFDLSKYARIESAEMACCPRGRLLAIAFFCQGDVILLRVDVIANTWCEMKQVAGNYLHWPLISFSPSRRFVMAAEGHRALICDEEAGTSQSYSFPPSFKRCKFLNDSTLMTNRGMVDLGNISAYSNDGSNEAELDGEESAKDKKGLYFSGSGVSPSGSWITWDGYPILWLPVEYRPHSKHPPETWVNEVVIPCKSGRIFRIAFSSKEVQAMMEQGRKAVAAS